MTCIQSIFYGGKTQGHVRSPSPSTARPEVSNLLFIAVSLASVAEDFIICPIHTYIFNIRETIHAAAPMHSTAIIMYNRFVPEAVPVVAPSQSLFRQGCHTPNLTISATDLTIDLENPYGKLVTTSGLSG